VAEQGLRGPTEQPSNGYLKCDVSCHIINRLLQVIASGNVIVVVLLVEIARSTTPAPQDLSVRIALLNKRPIHDSTLCSVFSVVYNPPDYCFLTALSLSFVDCVSLQGFHVYRF